MSIIFILYIFILYVIGFECLFSTTFTDEEKLAFQKLVEFYLQPVERDNSFVELKIWKVKISSGWSCQYQKWIRCIYELFKN
jgi:hypothetical protein